MKSVNKVYLEGLVDRFSRMEDLGGGRCLASIGLVTYHKGKDGEVLPLHHEVYYSGQETDVEPIGRELESSGGRAVIPVAVSGCLGPRPHAAAGASDVVVLAEDTGFARVARIGNTDNNSMSLSGRVVSMSFTDSDATLVIDADGSRVRTRIIRKDNEDAWKMVSDGRIRRGGAVSMSGVLVTRQFMSQDSVRNFVVPVVYSLQQLRLRREVEKGVKI